MAGVSKELDTKTKQNNGHLVCAKCSNHSVINEGGCLTCKECGWSKCD